MKHSALSLHNIVKMEIGNQHFLQRDFHKTTIRVTDEEGTTFRIDLFAAYGQAAGIEVVINAGTQEIV
jgi:hypothetical protein